MAVRYDFHLHTNRSDGQFPPEVVLARCAAAGLGVVALTDHDLPQALSPGEHVFEGRTIRLIAAAEVSGMHDGHELHLLVYFRDAVPEGFRQFCADQVRERAERYQAGRENLQKPGIPEVDAEALAGDRALTRHHLARALVAAGHAKDLREAFAKHVGDSTGMVPPFRLTFQEAIATALSHGGLTSWAHPYHEHLDRYLPTFVKWGLQGVEGIRPSSTSRDRRTARTAAKRHGLFVTGGSDWHGWYDAGPGLFAVERPEIADFLTALGI